MRTILCLYVPGFQRQIVKHVKILPEQSKEKKTKEEQIERPCCGYLLMHKIHSWPPNVLQTLQLNFYVSKTNNFSFFYGFINFVFSQSLNNHVFCFKIYIGRKKIPRGK